MKSKEIANEQKKSTKARKNFLKFLDEVGFKRASGERIFDDSYYEEKETKRLLANERQKIRYQTMSDEDRQKYIDKQSKWNKENRDKCREYETNYAKRNTRKRNAKIIANKSVKCPDGSVRHHWSYNYEDLEDVLILTQEDHQYCHRYLEHNEDNPYYYYTVNGLLLDTKEKHEEYLKIIMDFRDVVSDMLNFLRKFDFS